MQQSGRREVIPPARRGQPPPPTSRQTAPSRPAFSNEPIEKKLDPIRATAPSKSKKTKGGKA